MGRILMAGLLGGVVMCFWGAVAHMVLPIGMVGMVETRQPAQDSVLAAMKSGFTTDGIYMVPFMSQADWSDDAKATEFGARAVTQPQAFVVYHQTGVDVMKGFPMLMATQLGTDILAAILAALVVSFAALGLTQRALLVAAMGVFAWAAISLPYWNWYRFPLDFTLASLAKHAIGWLLAGFAIAWWLRRKAA